jgi:hypothetical protein
MFNFRSFLHLAALACLVVSCTPEEEDTTNPCGTPSLLINTDQGYAYLNVTPNGTQGFFEVQYGSNGFSLGSGTVVSINQSHTLGTLNNGTYDIYIRGNCGGTSWSDWSTAQSFLITGGVSGNCQVPGSIETYVYPNYVNIYCYQSQADYFEIEYGTTGFTLGSGTRVTNPTESFTITPPTHGTVYDFYLRANCGGQDFSAWSSANSFFYP